MTIEESQNVYPMKLEVYISVHPDAVEGQQMKMWTIISAKKSIQYHAVGGNVLMGVKWRVTVEVMLAPQEERNTAI